MTTPTKVADAVVAYVESHDWVSFVEAERVAAEHGVSGESGHGLESSTVNNVVFWVGGEAFIELMRHVLSEKRVHLHPSTMLVYLVDGKVLTLPLAKRPPTNGYSKPHWAPMTLRTVPFE